MVRFVPDSYLHMNANTMLCSFNIGKNLTSVMNNNYDCLHANKDFFFPRDSLANKYLHPHDGVADKNS